MARSRPENSARRMGAGKHLCRVLAHRLDQSDGSFAIIVAQASIITANAPRLRGTCGLPGGGNSSGPPRSGRSVGYCRASRWAVVAINAFIANEPESRRLR